MNRQEQIVSYANSFKGIGVENEELKETIRMAVIDGALWADEHPNEGLVNIDKVCEWLYQRQAVDLEVSDIEKFINDFKNEMESKYENK